MYRLEGLKDLGEIAALLNAKTNFPEYKVNQIVFDSRDAKEGDLFLPLKGNSYDAEQFVDDVLSKGAAVISAHNHEGPAICVEDTYKALLTLCRSKLENCRPKIIFITGSYGKTTLKDMIKHYLGNDCHSSRENENNEFGIVFTILSMESNSKFLVVECGARKIGDFDLIAENLFCDVFVLTSITSNHLETFKSLENIELTKLKLKQCLIHQNNFIDGRKVDEKDIKKFNKILLMKIFKNLSLDIDIDSNEAPVTEGRGNIIEKYNGKIINQTYNAHPDTVIASLSGENPVETIVVLGDMAELGPNELSLHRDLLKSISEFEIFVTGKIFKQVYSEIGIGKINFFADVNEFPKKYLDKQLKSGKKIYFKGSRSSKMENYLELLVND